MINDNSNFSVLGEVLESISDADRRAERERHVVTLALALLLMRTALSGMEDVVGLARDPVF